MKSLMKMMTEAYCPRSEIKKLEIELWNLTVKGTDFVSYTQSFQELALLCSRMVPEESDRMEKYVGGLPDSIQRNVMSAYCPRSEIKKLEIELWNLTVKGTDFVSYTQRFQELALLCSRMVPEESDRMEKYVGGLPDSIQRNVMSADNKRRMYNNPKDNHVQQPPYKRQNVARAYTVGPSEKKEYAGTLPLCNKCKLHHNGPCTVKYANCKKHSECPRLKNQNCENQTGNGEVHGRVYALGGGEAYQDPNNIVDDIDA
ncbi:hypothetical protein Tco_0216412 [Tanacetum coccineum]